MISLGKWILKFIICPIKRATKRILGQDTLDLGEAEKPGGRRMLIDMKLVLMSYSTRNN